MVNICGKYIYAHTHIYGDVSKIWSVLNTNMIPQVENSPPDFMQWVVVVVVIQVCSKFRTKSSPGYMFQVCLEQKWSLHLDLGTSLKTSHQADANIPASEKLLAFSSSFDPQRFCSEIFDLRVFLNWQPKCAKGHQTPSLTADGKGREGVAVAAKDQTIRRGCQTLVGMGITQRIC